MSKIFAVNVPDQLWVNSWNDNKTESYTYLGPDILHVLISSKTGGLLTWSTDSIVVPEDSTDIKIEINTAESKNLPIAHFLYSQGAEHEYTYETETNHDGSKYEKITNPVIQDYFDLKYDIDNGLHLQPMYKNSKTIAEEKAEIRLEYVKKYLNAYSFDTDVQATIDKFISDMNTYLSTMSTAYPWKYISIDENEIPKIPASLVVVFNALPEIR